PITNVRYRYAIPSIATPGRRPSIPFTGPFTAGGRVRGGGAGTSTDRAKRWWRVRQFRYDTFSATAMRWSAMTHVDSEAGSDEEVDPRWVRSRTRLLDAAAGLLRAGGIEAVTIDAVTRESRVARTTLYRHFGG